MIKKVLFISALCLALASSLHAITITENFAADPFSNGWSKLETANNVFGYNSVNLASIPGYLDNTMQRTNAAVQGQAYRLLDKTYYMPNGQNGSATATDIYLGFDFMFASTSGTASQFMVGIFNSNQSYSNTSTINSLGLDLIMNSNGLQIRSETINGSGAYAGTSTVPTGSPTLAALANYRFQTHYYISGGKVYADVKVGTFDNNGNFTANVFSKNGTLLYDSTTTSWDTVGMNALGLKNLKVGTTSSSKAKFTLDNLYFSTDGEQNMFVPSWVTPEPATMVLLGLGSLILSRRRKV